MEGDIEMWIKLRWQKKHCILKDNILTICNKKKLPRLKLHLHISNIIPEENREREFKINNGSNIFWFRAPNKKLKEEWLLKLNECKKSKNHEKLEAIKTLLETQKNTKEVEEELKILTSESGIDQISDLIAKIWDNSAILKSEMNALRALLNKKFQKQMDSIVTLNDIIKKDIYSCLDILKSEKQGLVVVHQFLKKNFLISENVVDERDFKFNIEKILDSQMNEEHFHQNNYCLSPKTNLLTKSEVIKSRNSKNAYHKKTKKSSYEDLSQSIKEENQDEIKSKNGKDEPEPEPDSDESYYSLINNSELFDEFQQSFIRVPSNNIQKRIDFHPKNPVLKKLVEENVVFKKFPIDFNAPKVRTILPAYYEDKIKLNAWAVLKSNIGKDLSKVTVPIYFNEPRSMLQSVVSFVEYKQQLEKANRCENSMLQTGMVLSTFFMFLINSAYSSRKPFNPFLGETYEVLGEDNNLRMISEQVSHHPPVAAFYGESDDFITEGYFLAKPTLTLKGFKILPTGDLFVTLKKSGSRFSLKRPHITIHNYIIGKMYAWNSGDFTCENLSTGEKAVITLATKGWNAKDDYKAEGFIYTSQNEKAYILEGNWKSHFIIKDKNHQVIDKVEKFPDVKDFEKQYMYSAWYINSNNLTKNMLNLLPPTDSRFRPDQRAFEYGDMKLASEEKSRLENEQRERRKISEKEHKIVKANFFDFEYDGKNIKKCVFKGNYWDKQKRQDWDDLVDIYN